MQQQFYAQFGEDKILFEWFKDKKYGRFVEVGAHNGVTHSNTLVFEKIGWSGVLVEAHPVLAAECRGARPGSQVFNCAVVGPDSPSEMPFEIVGKSELSSLSVNRKTLSEIGMREDIVETVIVPAKTLDSILAESSVENIDFITFDIEGQEWGALQGFSILRWEPEIVIVERNSHFADQRIMRYMQTNGYAYERTTGVNDWFIRSAPVSHGSD